MAAGEHIIFTVAVAVTCAQPPDAAKVLVTVYVPQVLVVKSISPVADEINTNPAVEVNTPAAPPPLKVGIGLPPD